MRATVLLIAAALWSAVSSGATDTQALAREMNIMREILRTASDSKQPRSVAPRPRPAPTPQVSRVTAHYLEGQGVLFRLSLRERYLRTYLRGNRFPNIDLSNVPDFVENIVDDVRESIGVYVDSEELETLRALREEQRDLREEQRDLRRKLRDQRREMSRASARDGDIDDIDDIEKEIVEVERELAASERQHEVLAEEIELEHERFRERREGRQEQRQIDREQAYTAFESLLLQTLCDYGATLKSLPDGEHVNLLIENAHRENGDAFDRVYVFEKADLLACQRQSIDVAKLRERAAVYDQ